MAYSVPLTEARKRARGKVQIRDKETRELPHVTIIRRTEAWQINLRTGQFMDGVPDPSRIPAVLLELVTPAQNWRRLREEWDRLYPTNPVARDADEEQRDGGRCTATQVRRVLAGPAPGTLLSSPTKLAPTDVGS